MKLPAMPFMVGDWRKDPGVQSLTFHDRGVWFEILCLMWESSERGRLLLNGKPMPEEALARLLGLHRNELSKTLTILEETGVSSLENGVLICRRMVRDESKRQFFSSCGKDGGNPTLKGGLNPPNKGDPKPKPTLSVAVSVSSSEGIPIEREKTRTRPSGIPSTLEEAIEWAGMEMVPGHFAERIWNEKEGTCWTDGNGKVITNFRPWIKQRWDREKGINKNGQSSWKNKNAKPDHEAQRLSGFGKDEK